MAGRCVTFGTTEQSEYVVSPEASVRRISKEASECVVQRQGGIENHEDAAVCECPSGRSMVSEDTGAMLDNCGHSARVARFATWDGFVEGGGEAKVEHIRTRDEFEEDRENRSATQLGSPTCPLPILGMPPGGMVPITWNMPGFSHWNTVQVPHPAQMYMAPGASFGWGFAQTGAAVTPAASPVMQDTRTTVMLRNIPNNYDRDSLVELIEAHGFAGHYDFLYLPLDFKSRVAIGYAFLNFTSHAAATRAFDVFSGFSGWKGKSQKICTVTWSETHQGQEANIELVRNSPMNRRRVAEECKPIIIKNGKRVKVPPACKRS